MKKRYDYEIVSVSGRVLARGSKVPLSRAMVVFEAFVVDDEPCILRVELHK